MPPAQPSSPSMTRSSSAPRPETGGRRRVKKPAAQAGRTGTRSGSGFGWLEDLPLAAFILDGDGIVRIVNARASERFGLRPGLAFLSCLGRQARARLESLLAAGDADSLILRDEEIRREDTTIADIWIRRLAPGAAPALPASALVLVDVSPARQTARAENLLAVADHTAEGLIAALAHELRHPLASLKGAAQLLLKRAGDERSRALAGVMEDEIARLDRLIQQVATFEGAGAGTGSMSVLNLHEAIDHALALTELRAREEGPAGLVIERDFDPSLPEIAGDRDALVQLFLNLLENAREALLATAGPRIAIRSRYRHGLRREGGTASAAALPAIEVCVEDNGPGLSTEPGGDIFAAYVSARGTRRGLGLAIAARIVRRHNGFIRTDRSALGGAAFVVALPLVAGRAAAGGKGGQR
ncbi:MAG: hypothetical protein D6740_02625 [Alphaproteobacteria bacterium]|nr:MAG: hypothetical protein D6740_02625 [Alphaproteobacteria bacterium]